MDRLQAWWFARQGLDTPEDRTPAEVARRFGWLRSVGSANPYLAVHARTGLGKAEIERAVAEVELVELPAARGCTYYVPRENAALALRLAEMGGCLAEFRMAERHLGVTDEEVRALADTIARALEEGPLDPRAIAARVSPRHLGEAGKKRGLTSTLSLGLSRLQVEGRIRRLPQGGRMDTERFQYALWHDGPRPAEIDEATVAREMAARFFRWIGPAIERQFRDFTGLSAKLAREAMVGLVPCPDDPSLVIPAEDVDSYAEAQSTEGVAVLLASLDPWLHLRRDLVSSLDPADVERALPYGQRLTGAGQLHDLDSHPIVMDGVLVGLWEFDPDERRIASWSWKPCDAVEGAIERTSEWIARELGDFRSFSLDSPSSRRPRIELLRSLGGEKV